MAFSRARVLSAAGAVILLAVVGGALFGWGPWRSSSGERAGIAGVGQAAPDFTLTLLGGGSARLSEQRGRVVLLNFWATWCIPCRTEMPEIQQLARDFEGKPFAVWTINLQEDAATIEPFRREIGLRLPVLLDDEGEVTRRYGVRGLPASFLVDRQGIVRQQRLGQLAAGDAQTTWTAAWLAQQVQALLSS